MNTRRAVVGGAGALVLAALGYRAWDRGVFSTDDGEAFAPWRQWPGRGGEGLIRPVRSAVLAANPHDTQPWLFDLGSNQITVLADRARNLGTFDPFRREMQLGLGCAVENIVLAAQAFGFASNVQTRGGRLTLSPGLQPLSVARIAFQPDTSARADALFGFIDRRHTNRGPYHRDRAIPANVLNAFHAAVDGPDVRLVLVTDPIARGEFAAMEVEATRRIIEDPEMSADSARWFRTGRREIEAHRDGVTTDAAGLSPLMVMGAKLIPDRDAHTADKYWLDMTRDTHAGTAAMFGMILVRDRLDMGTAIAAGRAWQHLHLMATANGIAAQPMNQPVEMVDRNAMLARPDNFARVMLHFTHARDWEPTFAFRMGYAQRPAGPSPRRPLEDVLVARG